MTDQNLLITVTARSPQLRALIQRFNEGRISAEKFAASLRAMEKRAMAGSKGLAEIKAVQAQARASIKASTQAILDQSSAMKKAATAAKDYRFEIKRTADAAVAVSGPEPPIIDTGSSGGGVASYQRRNELLASLTRLYKRGQASDEWLNSMGLAYDKTTKSVRSLADAERNARQATDDMDESAGRMTNRMIGGFRAALLLRSGMRELISASQLVMTNTSGVQQIMNKMMETATDSAWIFMGLKPIIEGLGTKMEDGRGAISRWGTALATSATSLTLVATAGLGLLSFLGNLKAAWDKQIATIEKAIDKLEQFRREMTAATPSEAIRAHIALAQNQKTLIQQHIDSLKNDIKGAFKIGDLPGEIVRAWDTHKIKDLQFSLKQVDGTIADLQKRLNPRDSQLFAFEKSGALPGGLTRDKLKDWRSQLTQLRDSQIIGSSEYKITTERLKAIDNALDTTTAKVKKLKAASRSTHARGREGRPLDAYAYIDWYQSVLPKEYRAAYGSSAHSHAQMLNEIERYAERMTGTQRRREQYQARIHDAYLMNNPDSLGMALSNWSSRFQSGASPLQQTVDNVGNSVLRVTNAWSSAMAGMTTRTMKARDAWRMVRTAAVGALTSIIAKLMQMVMVQAMTGFFGGFGGALGSVFGGGGLVSPGSSWGNTAIPGTGAAMKSNVTHVNQVSSAAAMGHPIVLHFSNEVHATDQHLYMITRRGQQRFNKRTMGPQ